MKYEANGLTITIEQDSGKEYELQDPELTVKAIEALIYLAPILFWDRAYYNQQDYHNDDMLSLFVAPILIELAQIYANHAALIDKATLIL